MRGIPRRRLQGAAAARATPKARPEPPAPGTKKPPRTSRGGSGKDRALAFVVHYQRTLFSLQAIVLTYFHQRRNNPVEGVNVVIPHNEAVELLLYHIYQVGFSFWDTGYAAALTAVLLIILMLIALFQFGYADKRVHYR